jgi:hypothetical protein
MTFSPWYSSPLRSLMLARQMGIPILCSLGYSVPLHSSRNGRSRIRKETT